MRNRLEILGFKPSKVIVKGGKNCYFGAIGYKSRGRNMNSHVMTAESVTKDYYLFLSKMEAFKTVFFGTNPTEVVRAINDISLHLPKGEIVGIMGHNGAGKSTLLRVLSGVYQATRGKITYIGSRSGLFEMGGVGATSLTGREFCERILKLQGIHEAELQKAIADAKEFSELKDDFDKKILTYSMGMKARLYFSVSTALQYEIYLIDETLTVGDERFQAKCWRRIRERLQNGASGFLVTHDWSAVLQLCKYCFWFEKGKIKKHGDVETIVQEYLGQNTSEFAPGAKFTNLPKSLQIQSNDAVSFSFEVESEVEQLYFGYSVERLQRGHGWKILALENNIRLDIRSGKASYSAKLEHPGFSPGSYTINLFLTSEMTSGQVNKVYDSKTWTRGSAIPLRILGAENRWMVSSL